MSIECQKQPLNDGAHPYTTFGMASFFLVLTHFFGSIPFHGLNGKIAEVNLDFSVLEQTGHIVRDRYHLGGMVQHGASTLPVAVFDQFHRHHTLEIHLATGFQNIIYDQMPAELRQRIYQWVEQHLHDEWKEGWDREQFIYSSYV